MFRFSWIVPAVVLASAQAVELPHSALLPGRSAATPFEESSSQASAPATSRFDREEWGLSEKEWARYLSLLRGVRGAFSPANLSPLEVLGIHAETEAERREYAERLAKILKEDLERILAFERAYQEAWARLYPELKPVAFSHPSAPDFKPGDRLALFLSLACDPCQRLLKDAYAASVRFDIPLDLYFTDAKTDRDIFAWIPKQGFDPSRIREKKLTFNYDKGTLASLFGPAATVPRLLIKRGQQWAVADLN